MYYQDNQVQYDHVITYTTLINMHNLFWFEYIDVHVQVELASRLATHQSKATVRSHS